MPNGCSGITSEISSSANAVDILSDVTSEGSASIGLRVLSAQDDRIIIELMIKTMNKDGAFLNGFLLFVNILHTLLLYNEGYTNYLLQ